MDAGGIMYANGDMMMNGTSPEMSQAQTVLNWNPNQLDIKTKSVEKTLEPLVMQVHILFSQIFREMGIFLNTSISRKKHILKIFYTSKIS